MLGSAVPMQATDLLAATGAAALGMLAVLHAMVWRAQRQRWALMFTLCMGLGSAYYLADPWLRPVGEQPNPAGSLAGAVLILTLVAAMADYVGLPRRLARRVVAVAVGAGVLALVVRLTGGMPRSGGFLVYAGYFTLLAAMSAWALRREPGRGHGVVLLSVLSYPLAVLAMLAGHVQPDLVRYVIIVPCVMLGMTVLTTGQMRERAAAEQEVLRRRAAEADLRRLNDSLELRVAARTAELQNMVDGLESFNRSVSHDLRGPLGGMAHALRLAREALDQGDHDGAGRLLDAVAEQAEQSNDLVHALLALARAGTGELRLQVQPLERLVDEALAQLRAAGVDTRAVHVAPLPAVKADAGLLRQVLVNLLGNALKFSAAAPSPRVEVGMRPDAAGTAVFTVRDNGVGFDPAAAERLFQPFQRLHGGQFQGSGVGLSIVKRVIERHGGRLWAEAAPGQGATFCFTLGPAPT
jgi:signal transduction histidine kinase